MSDKPLPMPCPFCGSAPEWKKSGLIGCSKIGCFGYMRGHLSEWNTRAALQPTPDDGRLERLEAVAKAASEFVQAVKKAKYGCFYWDDEPEAGGEDLSDVFEAKDPGIHEGNASVAFGIKVEIKQYPDEDEGCMQYDDIENPWWPLRDSVKNLAALSTAQNGDAKP